MTKCECKIDWSGPQILEHMEIVKCPLCTAAPMLLEYSEKVLSKLKKYGPSIVPHLMDSDDNDGQFLREAITAATKRDKE